MPGWIISLIMTLGRPALIAFLKVLEKRYPGIRDFVEEIIRFLEGSQDKGEAVAKLHNHCEGIFCPADLKGGK